MRNSPLKFPPQWRSTRRMDHAHQSRWIRRARKTLSSRVAFGSHDAHMSGMHPKSSGGLRLLQPAILFVGFGLVVLLVTACSGERSTGSTESALSTTARSAHVRVEGSSAGWLDDVRSSRTDREILGLITRFWSTYVATSDHADRFDEPAVRAAIAKVATGASFERLVTVARTNAVAGLQVRGAVVSHPRVTARTAATATVIDCTDDHTGIYQAMDGTRLDTDDPAFHQATFELVHRRTGWLVAAVHVAEQPCTIA